MQREVETFESDDSPVPSSSWLALGLLLAAYTYSWIDRYIFAMLMEPIRIDLRLSDWQIGLLSGFAFTLAYSIAGFPFARWSDRGRRSFIIAAAMSAWSLMTVLCGMVSSFAGLVLTRSGVAVCEAGCSPAAHSLISDYFPRRRRAFAFAIYGLGISFGIWLGLALGGMISQAYGWRVAFVAMGAPGLILALVILFALKEPPRGQFDHGMQTRSEHYNWREGLQILWKRRAFVAIALGLSFLSFNGSGIQLWAPTYMLRAGEANMATIGVLTGTANGIAGMAGTLLAGYVADRFSGKDPRWVLWIAMSSAAIVVPGQFLFLHTSGATSYTFYTLTMFGLSIYTAPLFAAGQMLLPPRLRAFGAATMLFLLNMIGPGAGPAAIGALSDLFAAQDPQQGLRQAMTLSSISVVPALLCLLYAASRLSADLKQTYSVEK